MIDFENILDGYKGNKMKIRIKTYNGELPSYLTAGKVYEVKNRGVLGFWIVTDDLMENYVLLDDCCFLDGGSWEVVEI